MNNESTTQGFISKTERERDLEHQLEQIRTLINKESKPSASSEKRAQDIERLTRDARELRNKIAVARISLTQALEVLNE